MQECGGVVTIAVQIRNFLTFFLLVAWSLPSRRVCCVSQSASYSHLNGGVCCLIRDTQGMLYRTCTVSTYEYMHYVVLLLKSNYSYSTRTGKAETYYKEKGGTATLHYAVLVISYCTYDHGTVLYSMG